MPKEIRMDYEEYENLLDELKDLERRNKELAELTKNQRHKLIIDMNNYCFFYDVNCHVSIDSAVQEIKKAGEWTKKEIEGRYINLNRIKNKWWFKLFGGKFKV